MSRDFAMAEQKFKDNCKAMVEDMQGIKQQGLFIYDNQMSLFASHVLDSEASAQTNESLPKVIKSVKPKFYGDPSMRMKIQAFEKMENTSIRSNLGYGQSSDDEFIKPLSRMHTGLNMEKSAFSRKYQTDVRAVERDLSAEESSDF